MSNRKKQDSSKASDGLDPLYFSKQMQDLFLQSQEVFAKKSLQSFADVSSQKNMDPFGLVKLYSDVWTKLLQKPDLFMQAQQSYMEQYFKLLQDSYQKLNGEAEQAIIAPEKGDRRFRAEEWENNAYFSFVKQAYLLFAKTIFDTLNDVEGLDNHTRKKLDFFTKQILDALAPSNFIFTNPSVLKETFETKGDNLVRGYKNLLNDFASGEGLFELKTVNKEAFKVGENIATTQGDVIYRNDLMELIRYRAKTDKVHKTPLLVIPPWINKYYILDLQPKNSLMNWLTEQGYDVFCISWVNPDEKLAQKSFESYLKEGFLEAVQVVKEQTGQDHINTVGYCLGGTLLSCGLSYLAAKQDTSINSATFLTSLIDFSDAGDMLVFIDKEQLEATEKLMREKGFYPAEQLKQTFSLMRANDLVWSFFVNNYLMGREPMAFDLLYWNDDSTNMPYAMHLFYLKEMYLNNNLVKPNALKLLDETVDLRRIEADCFFLSTREDHIAPWKATYEGPKQFKGHKEFVLAEAGHIAGVVNHPDANKYGFWTNAQWPEQSEQWLDEAEHHSGSWWPYWEEKWLSPKSGDGKRDQIKDQEPYKSLCKAPGVYVLKQF